jgi:hypothetical protein
MRFFVAGLLVIAAVALGARAEEPVTPREGQFTARWVVTGEWRGLGLGPAREVLVADLTGRLDAAPGGSGLIVDLSTRCLVLWDSASGAAGRCRWRHPSGDEIFGEVEGDLLAGGKPVVGRFVGGTGRYTGITGELRFEKWDSFLLDREDRSGTDDQRGRSLSAFTNHVKGSWRLPAR